MTSALIATCAGKPHPLISGAATTAATPMCLSNRPPRRRRRFARKPWKDVRSKPSATVAAHRRFVREARAAASVRHPNVASVFHLGKSGEGYFYAMEYVEGETLGNLIKRCGRLDPKIALEIMSQVAAGLAAVHEQKLVQRDIT